MSDPTPSSPAPAALPWWKRAWANRRVIATAIGAVLMFVTPFLPAQYQAPLKLVQTGLEYVKGTDTSSSSSSSSSASSPAAGCPEGTTRSLPHFCKCVGGEWRDYFDVDAGCPEG